MDLSRQHRQIVHAVFQAQLRSLLTTHQGSPEFCDALVHALLACCAVAEGGFRVGVSPQGRTADLMALRDLMLSEIGTRSTSPLPTLKKTGLTLVPKPSLDRNS